jgi:hypothetical protein
MTEVWEGYAANDAGAEEQQQQQQQQQRAFKSAAQPPPPPPRVATDGRDRRAAPVPEQGRGAGREGGQGSGAAGAGGGPSVATAPSASPSSSLAAAAATAARGGGGHVQGRGEPDAMPYNDDFDVVLEASPGGSGTRYMLIPPAGLAGTSPGARLAGRLRLRSRGGSRLSADSGDRTGRANTPAAGSVGAAGGGGSGGGGGGGSRSSGGRLSLDRLGASISDVDPLSPPPGGPSALALCSPGAAPATAQ